MASPAERKTSARPGGLNWYVNRNARFMVNYLHGSVDKFNGTAKPLGADIGAHFDAHRRAFRRACDARPGGFLATAGAGGSRYGRTAAEALRPAGFLSCRGGERPSGCRASRSISATVIRSKISDMASRTLVMVRRTAQALTSLQSRHG